MFYLFIDGLVTCPTTEPERDNSPRDKELGTWNVERGTRDVIAPSADGIGAVQRRGVSGLVFGIRFPVGRGPCFGSALCQDALMRIARFLSEGRVCLGELKPDGYARILEGDWPGKLSLTDQTEKVEKLLAPIVPTDILAIGLNYHDHAVETGAEVPANPMLFIKASNSLANPFDEIVVPANSSEVDYEAELVVVIGKDCRNVPKEKALEYVLGYTCGNDVSARDWQKRKDLNGGQFARGKSFDGFGPIGPVIVTPDEIKDPNDLEIRCVLNGTVMQDSNTKQMIYDVPTIIESLSKTMTIRKGSVIFTGTPSGVGSARKPPVFLKPGDHCVIEIEGIGRLENRFVAPE